MTKFRHFVSTAICLLAFGGFQTASAAMIMDSKGNVDPNFADGSIVPLTGTDSIQEAQNGQPAPFDMGYGLELFGPSFMASWTHSYGQITDTILSASITIGIFDHDSQADGSQLSLFDIDGNDLTDDLDIQFEDGSGGANNMYNEYMLTLGSSLFADLADGSILVTLNLAGPGLQDDIFADGGATPTDSNGAHLIFSKLTIETEDSTIPAVPIPAAAPLFLTALALFGLYRRRVT